MLGVALTLLSMTGVYLIAKSSSKSAGPGNSQVLVATSQIPAHTVFKSLADVETWFAPLSVPAGAVPTGTFDSASTFVKAELGSGRVFSQQTIYPKQVALSSMFVGLGGRTSLTNAYSLPKDDVAISMEDSVVNESGGAIAAGDYVDLLASYNPGGGTDTVHGLHSAQTQFVLQNLKVLAVGTWTPGAESSAASSGGSTMLTFQVSRQIALIIQHLKDFSGTWMTSVVLRAADSSTTYNTTVVPGDWYFHRLRNNFGQ